MNTRHDQRHTGLSTVDARTGQQRPVEPSALGRHLGAALLALHGIAHLVGTTDAIRAINDNASLFYLFDRWEITNTFTLVTATTLWTTVAAGFAIAAIVVGIDARWWRPTVVAAVVVSTILCVVALPQTFIGLIVNAVILGVAVRARPTRHEGSR